MGVWWWLSLCGLVSYKSDTLTSLEMMIVICICSSSCSGQRWSGRLGPRRRFSNFLTHVSLPIAEPEPEPVPETLVSRKLQRVNQKLRLPPITTTTSTSTTEYIRTLVGVKESKISVEDDVFTPNPWSIDTEQFQIVAAVPEHEHDKERVDKEVVID